MTERRLRFGPLWLVFLATTLTGAGMLLSRDGTVQAWGLGVLLLPIPIVGLLLLAYYVRTGRPPVT